MAKLEHRQIVPRPRLPLPALIAIGWAAIGDLLRVFGAGGASTVAVLALLVFLSFWLLLPRDRFVRAGRELLTSSPKGIPIALWGFGIWVATSMLLVGYAPQGIQNVSLYLIFILTMAYVARLSSDGTGLLLLRWLRGAALLGTVLWLPTVLASGLGRDGVLISRGAVAVLCLIGMIASVGLVPSSIGARLIPYYFAVVIALTLGRLPLAVAAGLLIASAFASTRHITWKLVLRVLIIAGVAVIVFLNYPPLQRRFLENDGQSIGGLEIGTSGRTNLWDALLSRITSASLLTGRGAGSAEVTITETFQRITQPHSDYLRILNDFGVIGLVLFVIALVVLLAGSIRRWRESPAAYRPVHLASILCVVTIAIFASLDNIIIYIFAMVPFAAIIGTSLSRPGVAARGLIEEPVGTGALSRSAVGSSGSAHPLSVDRAVRKER